MTVAEEPVDQALAIAPPSSRLRRIAEVIFACPATVFAVMSIVFGLAVIAVTPPLRGPDEAAHVMRILGLVEGDLLATTEVEGRKGLYLPRELYDDFGPFEHARHQVWNRTADYPRVFADYWHRRTTHVADPGRPPEFIPYQGSEAYTPVAYLPQLVAGAAGKLTGLDFVERLYLMRLAGLVVMTAVAAYAIALTPYLKWAFVLVAMLPAALFGRSMVGADGAALGFAMVATALSLRALSGLGEACRGERALFMTLCVLVKPPQVVFLLLEPMIHRLRDWPRRIPTIALVTLPGLILSGLWAWAVSSDAVSAWRIAESLKLPAEQFTPGWKLHYMLEHPLHFPTIFLSTWYHEGANIARQLIGHLGWLDVPLAQWVYPVLGIALVAVAFERLALERAARIRVAVFCGVIVASYVLLVFLILFMVWTPPTVPGIWGVQGRYFLVVLPAAAAMVAALCGRGLAPSALAATALAGSLLAGVASIEALWRVHW